MKAFLLETFSEEDQEEENRNRQRNQIFSDEEGSIWIVARLGFSLLAWISHTALCLSFLTFFLTALSFSINCAMEFTLEMISPPAGDSTSKMNFYSACLFWLLICTLFNISVMLSLFWEVVHVVLYKNAKRFLHIKSCLFLLIILSAGIWAGVARTASVGFIRFVSDCLVISWVVAFSFCIVGSLFLLSYVYTSTCIDDLAMCINFLGCNTLLTLVFSILSPIAFKLVGASTGAICFAFFYPFFTGIFCSYLFGCRGYNKNNKRFVIQSRIMWLTGAAYIAIIILASNARVTCGRDCQLGHPVQTDQGYMLQQVMRTPGYPICDKKWGSLRLGITDMAFLADLAYKVNGNKTQVRDIANEYFEARSVRWDVVTMSSNKPVFFHLRNKQSKVSVVGIRGTSDARDWFENAKIWNEIATFQIISVALPMQHLPLDFIAFFVSNSAFLDYTLHHASYNYYFKVLEDYVENIAVNTTEEVFLVGHSLGGGLAKIIGSRKQIPAISISSPGEVYNHVKFGYTLDDVEKYTTSVVAHNDLVTWIDKHGGLVQHVKCDSSSFSKCHSIENTYCELKRKCELTTAINCPPT